MAVKSRNVLLINFRCVEKVLSGSKLGITSEPEKLKQLIKDDKRI